MEPFHLNLHQVNFHSSDLAPPTENDLDSFGTIVNCEYHFSGAEDKTSHISHHTGSLSPSATGVQSLYLWWFVMFVSAEPVPLVRHTLYIVCLTVWSSHSNTLMPRSAISHWPDSVTSDLDLQIKKLLLDLYSEKEVTLASAPFTGNPGKLGVLDSFPGTTPSRKPKGKRGVTHVTKAITSPVTCATVAPSGGAKAKTGQPGEVTTSSHSVNSAVEIGYLKQIAANSASLKSYLTHYNMPVEEVTPQSPGTPVRTPDGMGTDRSHNASPFETVAEALHLQWSVIGDKNIQPASAEEIAQVIADAERRLRQGQAPRLDTPQGGAVGSPTGQSDNGKMTSMTTNSTMESSMTASETSSLSQDLSISETTETQDITQSPMRSTKDGPTSESEKSQAKELIRISAESITRTKERSSWFSGSSSKHLALSTPPVTKEHHKQKTSSHDDDKELSVVRETDTLSINSKKSEDQGSVSDTASDIASSDKLDAEVFLKSLPPLQPLDLSEFTTTPGSRYRSHSPPVRDTSSFSATNTTNTAASSKDSLPKTVTQSPMDVLESLLGQNYRMPFSRGESVPALGPLFQKSVRESRQKSPGRQYFNTIPRINLCCDLFSQVSSSSVGSVSGPTSEELEHVLREKAKLEGQLEMLSQEAETVMQERAELQALVASLKLKLKSQGDRTTFAEKEGLLSEVNSLRQSRAMLEEALRETQKLLDEKNEEARAIQEELQATQETTDKLHSKMKEIRDELKAKEVTIQALKNKVAELYVEVQTALQAKMSADNDARSAKNDVATLINAKEWYQQQLQLAHEARSQVQKQLTILQANTVSHGKVIERLKSENGRIRQQLTAVQSQALKEKEALARHLEAIESDMLDREAAFQEISRERSLMENTLHYKMNSVEAETSKLSELVATVADLEVQLEKAQNDLKRRHAHISILESEQSELLKRLNLSQENLSERDKIIEDLEQKLIEVEGRLKAFQHDVSLKDSEILKLKEEKATTEIALRAALEEKKTVDKALESLRGDMGKVEKSFRQMKQDLSSRSSELQRTRDEKRQTQEEMERLSTQFRTQQLSSESAIKDIQDKGQLVEGLMKEKRDLELTVENMRVEMSKLQSVSSSTENDEEKVLLRTELNAAKQALFDVQQQLQVAQEQKALSSAAPEFSSGESAPVGKMDESILQENEELKRKLKDVQSKGQKDFLKQKARATKLSTDMTKLQQELKDRQEMFESNVGQLSAKLRETIGDKERLETELEMLHRKFDLTMVEQKDQLQTELQTMASELETAQLRKQELESALFELKRIKDQEIEEYKSQLSALEEQLVQERQERSEGTKTEELNRDLALELEKERGRVAGLLQSQNSLKQHVGTLEEALARRESSLVDLHNHMQESVADREKAEHEYIRRIQTLEGGLQKEREAHRDVRKKIGQKITESKRVRRQYDSMKVEYEQLQQDYEQKQNEVRHLQTEYENVRQTELSQRTLVERLQSEKAVMQTECERLQRAMKDSESNNPVFAKQLETLEWQLKQKDAEISSLQDQVALSDQRHLADTENISKALYASQSEAELLRQELMTSKKEKYDLQSKMAELRGALKAAIQHYKLNQKLGKSFHQKNGPESGEGEQSLEASDLGGFDVETYEKLLEETAAKALNSKPLDDLHSCLSSLRFQISGLQKQVDDHTVAVHTSSQSWRIVEDQVKELRDVIRTVCGTNTSSTTTTVTTQASVEDEDGVEDATEAVKGDNSLCHSGQPGMIDV
ncbi:golgin subfamily A member 3-like [Liolophura sinensis]|uniref:golgin subfamily A member 3-like n=1 Tax=Liolophura sinensis TaxID=3198878 RepID=UPI0031595BC7